MKETFREGISRLREAVYRITGYKVSRTDAIGG